MIRLLLFLCFLSAPAWAQALAPCTTACPARYYWEVSPLTRTPPTAAPSIGYVGSGMQLAGAYGARVSLCPESGQTLTGGASGGYLRAYYWHVSVGTWMRNPALDLQVTATTTVSNPCTVWPDWMVGVRGGGYILYAPDAVLVSGGTTVTVRIDGQVTP